MKFLSKILLMMLIITTCNASLHPFADTFQRISYGPVFVPEPSRLCYDDVVRLLNLIESDAFEEVCSLEDVERINQLLSFLALEGADEEQKPYVQASVAALLPQKMDVQGSFADKVELALCVESCRDIVLCKSWFKKQWDQTRKFVKEHKKEIIIGVVIVVVVIVVVVAAVAISSSAAGGVAAGGGALAGALDAGSSDPKIEPIHREFFPSALEKEIEAFKKDVAQEQLAMSDFSSIAVEENGRITGSLFAHKAVDRLAVQAQENPLLYDEMQNYHSFGQYPTPGWTNGVDSCPHSLVDRAFSINNTPWLGDASDVNDLCYRARGNWALSSGLYPEAAAEFERAIERNPHQADLYLKRGVAHFEMGNYEQSIADYHQFVEKKAEPFSATDFSLGFAKGVPKGAYDSGEGVLLFLADFVAHPIQTSKQVVDSLGQLVTLVKNDEFGVVAEALSPELHQLVTQWDTLPSETRGELAGYAVGKLGADFLAPGAIAKVASKSVNSAKELAAVCKNLQTAQEILILETATGIGIPAQVSEIVTMGKKTATLGEELGFTVQEIGELQKARKLETAVANACEHLTPSGQKSFELFDRAQEFLKPYKEFMSESQARELIHQTGVKTFPRPKGVPENFKIRVSDKGAGMEYVHPTNNHLRIRVMPGKPHSPLPHQQKPYVIQMKEGKAFDKFGNLVAKNVPEAHIPLDEFVYRN